MAYTAPRTWVTGELVTAAMLNANVRDNQNAAFPLGVDAWTAYTPTLTQSATVTKTVTYAKYQRVGRTITVNMIMSVTGAGTASNNILIGLPVASAAAGNITSGAGFIGDSSAALNYTGAAVLASTTTVGIVANVGAGFLGASAMTAALASGDSVGLFVTYEAAT